MIIGKGDIASVLKDQEDRIYFASGVSNSSEIRESEFQREIDLLSTQPKDKRLVYFSSLCVFYSNTRYASHKRYMEYLVKQFPQYTILRLGNIDWGVNPHTLINYLKAHPEAEIKDTFRFIVSKKDLLYWIDLIPDWNCEMNMGKKLKVMEIKKQYV